MPLLSAADRESVRQQLQSLPGPVRLVHFTQALACDTCPEARGLVEEVAALSDQVTLQVLNLMTDREEAVRLGVDKVPATVVLGAKDVPLRSYGVASGYEFATLLEAMFLAAGGDSRLPAPVRARLAQVTDPIQLQVFVTPT